MPLSAHRIFNHEKYVPGAFVVASDSQRKLDEDLFRFSSKSIRLFLMYIAFNQRGEEN